MKEILCRADSIEECDCFSVTISEDCVEYLKNTTYNCLCNTCLKTVDALVQKANTISTSPQEGLHYYLENGMLVFSELNHIQRGYCCKSGCRHCAYGYKG